MKGLGQKYLWSLALGALLVWLAFKDQDFAGFGARLAATDVNGVIAYTVLFTTAHLLRILRWGVLVRALGPITWGTVAAAGAVGYMCIIVFPLRLGEFVRPYLVRGKGGVTASGALATVVVERVVDGLLFVALFFVFIAMLPPSNNPAVGPVKASAWVAGAVFSTTLIVLAAAHARRAWTVRFIERVGHRIHRGLTDKALGLLEAFLDGLAVLPDRRRLGIFLALTAVYWLLLGVGMQWLAVAVNIPDLTYTGAFALLAVVVVGIMIPAGPGFTGTFELAMTAGFSLLVLSPDSLENVALYTLMLHVIQLLVQVSVGAGWLLTGRVDLAAAIASGADDPPAPEAHPPR
ncbi:MAG: flippase-like domain-containing protein [Myxococcales bacterium]|nr:flippase-like domain-containing protein [Myxococcales bacterium]MCB9522262.1 flippase-like domain-containing protein [Myxococcales bacterium]